MNDDVIKRIEKLEEKIDLMYTSVEKTRKYLLTSLIITIVTITLPLVVAAVAVPYIISTFSSLYGGLL
jgi:hypothetical protein